MTLLPAYGGYPFEVGIGEARAAFARPENALRWCFAVSEQMLFQVCASPTQACLCFCFNGLVCRYVSN